MLNPQQPLSGDSHTLEMTTDNITSIYGNLCEEFGRVENARQGMLQYVFAATSLLGTASVFAGAITNNSQFQNFLIAVGVLGMISVFALFIRELQLNFELDHLVEQGQLYEQHMRVVPTMFLRSGLSAPSTALIYSGAMAGWFCVATWFAFPKGVALSVAFPVFLIISGLNWFMRIKLLSVFPKAHPAKAVAR